MASRKRGHSQEAPLEVTPVAPRKPLVFMSHDSRDAKLAAAFEMLLTDASGGMLKTFRSSDRQGGSGIDFGAEWYSAIMTKLGEATDVVALLTPNSIDRPWILYEVGVARGKLSTPAFGVVFGVSLEKVVGPFAQFQNSADDEDSLTKLVLQLIRRNPDASPREEAVKLHVSNFRSRLAELVESEPVSSAPSSEMTTVLKLFEEVKIMFRELPNVIARPSPATASESWLRSSDVPRLRASFIESFRRVDEQLRVLATALLRLRNTDLAAVSANGVIPKRSEQQGVERITFGELLKLIKYLNSLGDDIAPYLADALDDLQQVISVRNRLVHGEAIEPEESVRAWAALRQFMDLTDTAFGVS